MECEIPNLTLKEYTKILHILQYHNLLHSYPLLPDHCMVEKSKKNIVVSIKPKKTIPILVKLFKDDESWKNEIKIYTFRQDHEFFHQIKTTNTLFAIPKILHWNQQYIITEYIQGVNIMDLITNHIKDDWKSSFWEELMSFLIMWIAKFSDIYGFIPLDCHARNFIMKNRILYGVDFEDLGLKNNDTFLEAIATFYFSILGAYPGVIEGLELEKKARIGSIILQVLNQSEDLVNLPPTELVSLFIKHLEKEYKIVIQRRIALQRGSKYKLDQIDSHMRTILSQIVSESSILL